MTWNFNIDDAPRGEYEDIIVTIGKKKVQKKVFNPVKVITASKCEKVIVTSWLPDEGRWNMYSKKESPIAWQLYPEHPHKEAA